MLTDLIETTETNDELWSAFAKTRGLDLRNKLVLRYTGMVKHIVLRLIPSYAKHMEFDDLISNGILGLLDAVDKFDPNKGVKFETYAGLRVKGQIIDALRGQDWAPAYLRQKIKQVEDAYETLESENGAIPTEKEVAQRLKTTEDAVRKTMDDAHTFNIVALDDMLADRLGKEGLADEETPADIADEKELIRVLGVCIDRLPERQRLVVSLYYHEQLNLKEIGAVIGVSESRVSQIHAGAVSMLRRMLEKEFA